MSPKEELEFIEELCAVDSRTLAGSGGTTEVAQMLGDRLGALGFETALVPVSAGEENRGLHLKAIRNPEASPLVLFMGHTDTVLSPADVPFRHDVSSGKLYGAGVCDMKGGCVVLLSALEEALAESEEVRDAGQVVLLNCTEEVAGPSFRELARKWAEPAAAALNFEPGRLGPDGEHRVVVSRKGVMRFNLSCSGRAAHAGNAHRDGISAIREVARKIEQVENMTDDSKDLTVNVGVVSGGRVTNQVPEQAAAGFDVRAFDPSVLEAACQEIRRICVQSTVTSEKDGATTHMELSENRSYPPWPHNPGSKALLKRCSQIAYQYGVTLEGIASGGGADASHVADLVPTLDGMGILGGGMHTLDEWADSETLHLRAQIAGDLLHELCAYGLE